MPFEEIRLGPFVGGLNTFSDPTAIADVEVAQLINFELDIDGSLVNRPPMEAVGTDMPGADTFGLNILGWFEADGGAKYLIGSNRNNGTYYFDGANWILITNTIAASAMVQYRNKAWLVAPIGSTNNGGSWQPGGAFTADANMPKGGCAVAYKDRIFIGPGAEAPNNGARLYLSNLNAVWPATQNFFNIGAGDGQNIVDVAIYADSILIFKQGSTYRYAYSNDPALGSTIPISYNIGALTRGCYAAYQDQLYVLFDNKVYEFSSFNYNELNMKVPLRAINPAANLAESASISVWADRVLVQYYDQTYSYSLKTRTWSLWESTVAPFMGRFWAIPGQQTSEPTAYTYSTSRTGYLGLFRIKDIIGSTSEEMVCTVVTKNYDYLDPARFKRLSRWGIDAISKVGLDAIMTPIMYGSQLTWDQLKQGSDAATPWAAPPQLPGNGGNAFTVETVGSIPGVIPPGEEYITLPSGEIQRWTTYVEPHGYTWDYLAEHGATWDRLLEAIVAVVDSISTLGGGSGRKYLKVMKSTRFRQVSFQINATTKGDSTTAPLRIFSIMTRVANKQSVSKKIS